jgi:Fe-S-cluster-containing hydrogenase component 2
MNPVAKQMTVVPEKCLGCGVCEQVCAFNKARDFDTAQSAVTVITYAKDDFSVPLMCQQCGDAPCAKICPVGALAAEENGVVAYDKDKCILCRLCAEACPFGNLSYSERLGRMNKCDRCEGRPVCVTFCPAEAIVYGESKEAYAERRLSVAETIRNVYALDWREGL